MKALEKVAVWGDSILKGIVQNKKQLAGRQYVVLPENALSLAEETIGKKYSISVSNRCYFGSTITKGKKLLERDLNNNIECDTGIIEFGGNDCNYNWNLRCEKPEEYQDPSTPINQFLQTLQEMIGMLRERCIRPVLMTLPPLVGERYYKTISKGLDPEIILDWLGDTGYLYRWHEMYSDEIAKLAIKNDCYLVDMRKAFLQEHNYQRLICDDGIHPNAEGHVFMSHILEQAVLDSGRPLVNKAS